VSQWQEELRDALKMAASALKQDGPPFALAGGYALWTMGGPEPTHDVDVVVAEEDIERAVEMEVLAMRMPVLPPTEMITVKLRSLSEHHCDFARLLPAVRAVREQLDWPRVRRETADNNFAVAFLVLTDRLEISPRPLSEGVLPQ
jgi:hypothetical protein